MPNNSNTEKIYKTNTMKVNSVSNLICVKKWPSHYYKSLFLNTQFTVILITSLAVLNIVQKHMIIVEMQNCLPFCNENIMRM